MDIDEKPQNGPQSPSIASTIEHGGEDAHHRQASDSIDATRRGDEKPKERERSLESIQDDQSQSTLLKPNNDTSTRLLKSSRSAPSPSHPTTTADTDTPMIDSQPEAVHEPSSSNQATQSSTAEKATATQSSTSDTATATQSSTAEEAPSSQANAPNTEPTPEQKRLVYSSV